MSRRDTQGWHSPNSFFLRQWRQTHIIGDCVAAAREDGYEEYAIFDADETYLAGGRVDAD